jgi:GT2 family glycosyltransferase
MGSARTGHDLGALEVLVPTAGRTAELAVTLAGLAAQEGPPFRVRVSDQSDDHVLASSPAVLGMLEALENAGRPVTVVRHLPRRGLAEHRQSLLAASEADAVLFLDDDVWLEPDALLRMREALGTLGCGFVGMAPQGLSFLDDRRPHEHGTFQAWQDGVQTERVRRDTPGHERWRLHNAANLTHIAAETDLGREGWLPYRIAWVGACTMYRREALEACGGFGFWQELPPGHSGEDVVAQWRVMERFGGAGILPSGAVHLESPTTVTDRSVDAPDVVLAGEELADLLTSD